MYFFKAILKYPESNLQQIKNYDWRKKKNQIQTNLNEKKKIK